MSSTTVDELGQYRDGLRPIWNQCLALSENSVENKVGNKLENEVAAVGNSTIFPTNVLGKQLNNRLSPLQSAILSSSLGDITNTPTEACDKVSQVLFVANAFVNTCPTVSNFKYRAIKCDPGTWCGCSDPSLEKCEPSNNLDETFWAGRYTEKGNGSNPIVYTGWASKYPPNYFQCNQTLYCPGYKENTTYCPRLCNRGYYCPTSSEQIICPIGNYCPIGSTAPMRCEGLHKCSKPGLSEQDTDWYLLLVVSVALVVLATLFLCYSYLNKKFPFRKSNEQVNEVVDEEAIRTDKMKRQSSVTVPKPTIDIDLSFKDLQLTLKNGKCIMNGVTGELKGGQFTAIMGPSGAGKSTFLSLLSGKTEPTGGMLSVNGKKASLKNYRSLVGFVPQEDTMLRELSVEENIRHSAFMRLPKSMSREKKLKRVYQVMESLELLDIRDSIIGNELVRGISGGQRKRVNVAMELVADPSLLALDEPTSGLDSTSSSTLCEILSELAMTGVNVAAVIHQPKITILQQFSDVLLLGVGGRTVYMGRTEDMEPYFDKMGFPLPPQINPADYYMDVIAGLIPCSNNPNFKKEDLFEIWKEHIENESPYDEGLIEKGYGGEIKTREAAGFFEQVYLLFKRAILQRCRTPLTILVPVVLSAGTGCLIGFFVNTLPQLYYGIPRVSDPSHLGDSAAAQFMMSYPIPPYSSLSTIWLFTALCIMLICVVSINTFGPERAVFSRESFSGTNPFAYWLAKTCESGLWIPIYAAIFVTVNIMIKPQPISVLKFFIVVWISIIGDFGIGHIVSLLVAPANRGIVHLVSCLLLIMIFSGTLIHYHGRRLFNLFYTFWVAQGYAVGFYETIDDVFNVELFNEKKEGFDLSYSFGFNVLCGVLTALLWHLIALMIMIFRSR